MNALPLTATNNVKHWRDVVVTVCNILSIRADGNISSSMNSKNVHTVEMYAVTGLLL